MIGKVISRKLPWMTLSSCFLNSFMWIRKLSSTWPVFHLELMSIQWLVWHTIVLVCSTTFHVVKLNKKGVKHVDKKDKSFRSVVACSFVPSLMIAPLVAVYFVEKRQQILLLFLLHHLIVREEEGHKFSFLTAFIAKALVCSLLFFTVKKWPCRFEEKFKTKLVVPSSPTTW